MTCLASAAYDPAVAQAQVTTALLAMTAIDTANLRLTFTAPANGNVLVRLRGMVSGATTFPRILLGVIENSPSAGTVRMRQAPMGQYMNGANLTTTLLAQEAVAVITGLTPGNSYTWDAAYGVEILFAGTNLRYGGPNTNAGGNAFGAFVFEIWSTENLLGGTLYDPAAAVTQSCTALLAMTAMDTTNLRLTITAPASGKIMWRLRVPFHGSTTPGSMLLGLLEASTVVARVAPILGQPQTGVATGCLVHEASGVISGLSGSHTYDAAYAVQTVAGAGGLKYGGPNNTTTNDAFGGASFEIWVA